MRFRVGEIAVRIGYETAAAVAAVLILDHKGRIAACFLAAALHECGHLLMMRRFGVCVRSVTFRLFDVLIQADSPATFCADWFITLGGVMANFVFALLSLPLSRVLSAASFAIGLFNLLPVMGLDGGRLLYLLLSRRFLPRTCGVIIKTVSFLFLFPLMTAGLLMLFRSGYNYSLLAISLYLLAVLLLK